MNKKILKPIIIVFSAFLSGALITSLIYALFFDKDNINNTVTIGDCNVIINEEFDPPDKYEAGDIISKKPWVENIGNVPCYVRIRADISNGQIANYLEIDFDSDEWSPRNEDGYYYYIGNSKNKGILQPGEVSAPLFTQVKIADNIPSDLILNFDIYVYAEAVQSYGFDTAQEAWLRFTPENI